VKVIAQFAAWHDACSLGTLLVLAGPKGVGKSWVAEIAEREFGVHYVDADRLILDLIEQGSTPDPEAGWLHPVQVAVLDALVRYPAVSAEITGAWDSDYELIRNVRDAGHGVMRIWIIAPLEETLARLRGRTSRKVPVSEAEARSTYQQAVDRARVEQWDAAIETSGAEQPETVRAVIGRLLEES
jgi:shikimate kinase